MTRLLPPRRGQVLLDGRDVHTIPAKELARRLGLLPQSPLAPEGIAVADLVADFPSDIRPAHIVAVTLPDAMPRRMRLLLRLPVRAAREKRAALTSRPRAKGVIPWATLVKARRVSASVPVPTLDDIAAELDEAAAAYAAQEPIG